MKAESPRISSASHYLSVLAMKGNYSGAQPGIIYRKVYIVFMDTSAFRRIYIWHILALIHLDGEPTR